MDSRRTQRFLKVFVPALAIAGIAAGCGRAPVSLKGPDRIQEARQIILKRVRSFHTEQIVATVQATGPGLDRAATVSVKASGLTQVREVINTGPTTLVAVDNGSTAWTYTMGGSRYGIAGALSPSGFDLRWAAGSLNALLSAVSFRKVRTLPGGRWLVTFAGSVPGLGSVQGQFVYGSRSGLPRSLTLRQGADTVAMTFSTYRANPALNSRIFTFNPPAGATPVLADGAGISALNALQQSLRFSLAVPVSRSGLALVSASSVSSSVYGTEALLEFNGSAGPLLLTEYAGRFGLPPSSPSSYPATVGGFQVTMTANTTGTLAALQDGGTAVIAEGGEGEVTAALQNLVTSSKG
ncbi:MAG: hypothetical protein ACP5QO_13825 [Clostridia bacterium]